jgi:hypothetical protein
MGKRIHEVRKSFVRNSLYIKPSLKSEEKNLIRQMLEKDKDKRISIKDILADETIHSEYLTIMKQWFPNSTNLICKEETSELNGNLNRHQNRVVRKMSHHENTPILKLYKPKYKMGEVKQKAKVEPIILNKISATEEFLLKRKKNKSPIERIVKSGIHTPVAFASKGTSKSRYRSRSRKITIENNYSPRLYDLTSATGTRRQKQNSKNIRYLSIEKQHSNARKKLNEVKSEVKHGATPKSRVRQRSFIKVEPKFETDKTHRDFFIYEAERGISGRLKRSVATNPSTFLTSLSRDKRIHTKKNENFKKNEVTSQSTLLKFENRELKTLTLPVNHQPSSMVDIVTKSEYHPECKSIPDNTVNFDYSYRKQKPKIECENRSRTNIIEYVNTVTTTRTDYNSPDIYSPKRISSYLKVNTTLPFQKIKKKRFRSIIKREKNISLSQQVHLAKEEKKNKIILKNYRKSEIFEKKKTKKASVIPKKIKSIDNKTQKMQMEQILKKNQMTKTLKKFNNPLKKSELKRERRRDCENRQTNHLRIETDDSARLEEFKRMRSPQTTSLFEEYKQKMQKNNKPISLNTYYKIPLNSNFLKKKKRKRRKK